MSRHLYWIMDTEWKLLNTSHLYSLMNMKLGYSCFVNWQASIAATSDWWLNTSWLIFQSIKPPPQWPTCRVLVDFPIHWQAIVKQQHFAWICKPWISYKLKQNIIRRIKTKPCEVFSSITFVANSQRSLALKFYTENWRKVVRQQRVWKHAICPHFCTAYTIMCYLNTVFERLDSVEMSKFF